MIEGLMSKDDFVESTKVDYNFRWTSMKDIGTAIETAHGIVGGPAQHAALLNVLQCAYKWKLDYRTRKPTSRWQASRRAAGVIAMEKQIRHLFATTLLIPDTTFRQALKAKKARAASNFSKITGIGTPGRPALSFPNTTKSLSSQDYVYEFLEPRHRANATQLSHQWRNAPGHASFGEYVNGLGDDFLRDLDNMNGKVQVGESEEFKWVQYLTAEEREDYELKPKALNKFGRDLDGGTDFHTGNHESEPKHKGWSIFVMDEANHIYSHSKVVKYFHHSSFLSGGPTKSAGTLRVDRGSITHITMASGHYAPGATQALAVLRALLVKFATGASSLMAQAELDMIRICPDFQQVTFYNSLEFLKSGGNTAGLTLYPFPPNLTPIKDDD